MFSSSTIITSLAMYSSDIGIAGTAMNAGKFFYKYPGKWLSTRILLSYVYDAVHIVPSLAFATKYLNEAANSLSSCMSISIPLLSCGCISFVKKSRYKTYRIHEIVVNNVVIFIVIVT